MPLNPALKNFSREAAIIGRILLAFGELEYMACKCAAENSKTPFPLLRALYRINGTSARIDAADALARETYIASGVGDAFADALGALRTCASIRNQYAHCAWADGARGRNGGLYFVDLSVSAEASQGWEHHWRHVNVPLLRDQYAFFEYTKDLIFHVETGAIAWKRSKVPAFPKPPKREPPRMHNPPERHIPRWISAEEQARHIAHALAARETVRSQKRARMEGKRQKPKKPSRRAVREMKMKAARRKRRPS